MKKAIIVFVILVILCAIAAAGGYFYLKDQLRGYTVGNEIEVTVPNGASGRDVAELLEKKGVIKNALVFRLGLRRYLPSGKILSGKYQFNSSDSVYTIIKQLEKGIISLNLITVPEGLTLKETAEIFDARGACTADEFIKAAKNGKFIINGKEISSVEGYLLPNTYDIPKEFTPDDILNLMLADFDKAVSPMYEEKKNALPVKLSLEQVVVLASLIEREAAVPSERDIIAGVYYNRLKQDMKLECDATIQYILGKQKEVLLYSDLEVDSPYNTYKYIGLPPGPIANPGIESIEAALAPQKHGYYFYVLNGIANNGSHVFSKTSAEHERAVRKYLK